MAVFGRSGGFAAVSTQFQFGHAYDSRRAKGEPWNTPIEGC